MKPSAIYLPWRHVILRLSLAEFPNGASYPFSVWIPAAHLTQGRAVVISVWLLD